MSFPVITLVTVMVQHIVKVNHLKSEINESTQMPRAPTTPNKQNEKKRREEQKRPLLESFIDYVSVWIRYVMWYTRVVGHTYAWWNDECLGNRRFNFRNHTANVNQSYGNSSFNKLIIFTYFWVRGSVNIMNYPGLKLR